MQFYNIHLVYFIKFAYSFINIIIIFDFRLPILMYTN